MFSATEALGLVMAVLDGHHDAGDPTDPVGSALGKIVRALPEPVAAQAEAVRRTTAPAPGPRRRPARSRHDERPGAGVLRPPAGADPRTADRPSTEPLGATRKTVRPCPAGGMRPTAPVSQYSSPRRTDSAAAGAEITLP